MYKPPQDQIAEVSHKDLRLHLSRISNDIIYITFKLAPNTRQQMRTENQLNFKFTPKFSETCTLTVYQSKAGWLAGWQHGFGHTAKQNL